MAASWHSPRGAGERGTHATEAGAPPAVAAVAAVAADVVVAAIAAATASRARASFSSSLEEAGATGLATPQGALGEERGEPSSSVRGL